MYFVTFSPQPDMFQHAPSRPYYPSQLPASYRPPCTAPGSGHGNYLTKDDKSPFWGAYIVLARHFLLQKAGSKDKQSHMAANGDRFIVDLSLLSLISSTMSRHPRIILPNCPHHIVHWHHNRQTVFAGDDDYAPITLKISGSGKPSLGVMSLPIA